MDYYFWERGGRPPDVSGPVTWTLDKGTSGLYNRKVRLYTSKFEVSDDIAKITAIADARPGIPYDISEIPSFPRILYEALSGTVPIEFSRYVFGTLRFEVYIRSRFTPGRGLVLGRFFDDGKPKIFVSQIQMLVRILDMPFEVKDVDYRLSPIFAVKWLQGNIFHEPGHAVFGPAGTDPSSGHQETERVYL